MFEAIAANRRKSMALVVLMAAILLLTGYALGEVFVPGFGIAGVAIALVLWAILALTSIYGGDSIFLAMSGARKIGPEDHPVLYNVVEEMTIASGLPKVPDIYLIDDPAPNAFATGRKPELASVAVTTGLLNILTRDELQGVMAHEIGHVKNRDVLTMMVVGIMMGTIVILADMGLRALIWGGGGRRTSRNGGGQLQLILMVVALVLIILSPIIAQLIYFALSRKREYLADASSAQFTRYPLGLASALKKISSKPLKLASATRATAPMFIVNPLKVTSAGLANMTSTHPPITSRVRILESMAGSAGFEAYDDAYRQVTGRAVGVIPHSALAESAPAPITPPETPIDQILTPIVDAHRAHTDIFWRLNDFLFIACACGTGLKIPPEYKGKVITCPHCLHEHRAVAPEPTDA